jgi:hypothetical protein
LKKKAPARTVNIEYRQEEDGSWSATSSDIPRYTAFAKTYPAVKRLVHQGVPFFLATPAKDIALQETVLMPIPTVIGSWNGNATHALSATTSADQIVKQLKRRVHELKAGETRVEVA